MILFGGAVTQFFFLFQNFTMSPRTLDPFERSVDGIDKKEEISIFKLSVKSPFSTYAESIERSRFRLM